ncbi:Uncharacterised protein [Sphingobacterium mizutaii]|uniref:Uncharacterized protein n=1 Tax=Sphingobacterium mizutaii TaxID=1010 RepID=A0AAJ4XAD1_9SPHI|nr:hypothetical protein [Sphingobacterium mizutaii]SDK90069.1 hypothetical protein SAMN05192578_101227 [Sphingobacterium mizutaii]SNV47183.1 Uncharacterised protein [Sphingobacterium mizutaii]
MNQIPNFWRHKTRDLRGGLFLDRKGNCISIFLDRRHLNQEWKGLEDRPRFGHEPGWGSTPLTQRGLEDGPRLWSICRWKDPNTVGAYRIRPQHAYLNYYHLLINEIHRFSNSWSNNFYKPIPSHGASTFYPFFCQGNEPEAKGLPEEDLMFVVNPQSG